MRRRTFCPHSEQIHEVDSYPFTERFASTMLWTMGCHIYMLLRGATPTVKSYTGHLDLHLCRLWVTPRWRGTNTLWLTLLCSIRVFGSHQGSPTAMGHRPPRRFGRAERNSWLGVLVVKPGEMALFFIRPRG